MKYAIQIGSSIMIHIPTFIMTSSVFQKLKEGDTQTHRGGYTDTQTAWSLNKPSFIL
jgi:hypothetical protein